MRLFLIWILLIGLTENIKGQQLIHSVKSGKWSDPYTWDLNRLPQEGDVIEIFSGHEVESDLSLSLENVILRISGVLRMPDHQTLQLNANSAINIFIGGSILSESQDNQSVLKIGDAVKYRGNKIYINAWGAGTIRGLASSSYNIGGDIDQGGSGFLVGSLPATWQDFNVFKAADNEVQMVWVTSHETGNRSFEIQKRKPEEDWKVIGVVQSDGNPSPQNIYSYIDNSPGVGSLQYRIKHSNSDGQVNYSAVRTIRISSLNSRYSVFPNPVREQATLRIPNYSTESLAIRILNSSGQLIKIETIPGKSQEHILHFERLRNGIYFIQILEGRESLDVLRIIKY